MRQEKLELTVYPRKVQSGSHLKHLRRQGNIPGIVYGADLSQNIPVQIDSKLLNTFLSQHRGQALIDLRLGEKTYPVIIKEIQRHILTGKPQHIDFQVVSLKKKVEVNVSVELVGTPVGVSAGGGILEHITRQIHIRCLPTEIPESIKVDVSRLNVGDSITVGEIKLEKVEILTDPRTIIANVVTPKEEEVPLPTPEAVSATPAEPEVIAKGKKEEVAEEAPAPSASSTPPAEKEKGKK